MPNKRERHRCRRRTAPDDQVAWHYVMSMGKASTDRQVCDIIGTASRLTSGSLPYETVRVSDASGDYSDKHSRKLGERCDISTRRITQAIDCLGSERAKDEGSLGAEIRGRTVSESTRAFSRFTK